MIDNQERYKWVNDSPGQSQTKGHKTVVVLVLIVV